MRRLLPMLAALAVLSVLGTLGTAVVLADRAEKAAAESRDPESPPAGPAEPETELRVFPEGMPLYGARDDNALVELPGATEGWSPLSEDVTLYYVDEEGDPAVSVNGGALFDRGFCQDESRSEPTNRGFVGFTRTATGMGTEEANTRLSADWQAAVSVHPESLILQEVTPVVSEQATLADGSTAFRSDFEVTVTDPGACEPPALHVTLLSLATGENIATLVMVRDLRTVGALSEESAESILSSLRQQLPADADSNDAEPEDTELEDGGD